MQKIRISTDSTAHIPRELREAVNAALEPEDFALYTTYENACPDYYRDILSLTGDEPAECLMVGNDASEDMAAETLGMQVFLLTDCLINREQKDISRWPHGGFAELKKLIFG